MRSWHWGGTRWDCRTQSLSDRPDERPRSIACARSISSPPGSREVAFGKTRARHRRDSSGKTNRRDPSGIKHPDCIRSTADFP